LGVRSNLNETRHEAQQGKTNFTDNRFEQK
jgi:hypothetical protein